MTHVLYLLLPQKSISAIRFELEGAWVEIGSGGSEAISAKVGIFFSPDLNEIFRVGRDTPQTMEYEKIFKVWEKLWRALVAAPFVRSS